jgi:hypothetical protein
MGNTRISRLSAHRGRRRGEAEYYLKNLFISGKMVEIISEILIFPAFGRQPGCGRGTFGPPQEHTEIVHMQEQDYLKILWIGEVMVEL